MTNNEPLLVLILAASIRLATPILITALGETFSQRSGVLNLGLEGYMSIGAFLAFLVTFFTGDIWIGVLAGIASGALVGLVMAFLTVSLNGNQSIIGLALFIFGVALPDFLQETIFGTRGAPPSTATLPDVSIPVLGQIPILGPILFRHNILVYITIFLLVPLFAIALFRTTWGLKIRAVGENPAAADTAGVNVYLVRYLCIMLSGAMAGLGGAYLTLAVSGKWVQGIVAGRGWLALSTVILANRHPFGALGAALLFAGVDALQMRLQIIGIGLPPQLLLMLPYVSAIVALAMVARKARAPSALTKPYKRE